VKDNIEMDLKYVGLEGVDWINWLRTGTNSRIFELRVP
jgi:hypothetical protein